MTNHCPFCGNYAYTVSVGDAYQMDCRYCDIQVEITKRAYGARCPNPAAVLDYIREKMKRSTRPRVDLPDMKRTGPPLALEENMTTSNPKQTSVTETDNDMLTTAAKAIGTTLGKIAVKTGIAHAPASAVKVRKKVASKKKPAAAKKVVAAKGKAASKKSPRKPAAKK